MRVLDGEIPGVSLPAFAPYRLWNQSVDLTGYGKAASANEGTKELRRLRQELGDKFEHEFRLRMVTVRAHTLEQLLKDWLHERTKLGV